MYLSRSASNGMKVNIFSLKEILFQGEASSLNLRSVDGELTILPNHIPLITELTACDIKIIDNNDKTFIIPISSGFLEVNPTEVKVLCEYNAKNS